jgi:hypothetical protein
MSLDISSLTWWASLWDAVSVVSAGFVLLGVVGESVADFEKLARWTGLAKRGTLRIAVSKAGLLVLIAALAIEVVAAIGSHNINEEIIATLNGALDQTIRHDIELTKLTGSLGLSNTALQLRVKDEDNLLTKTTDQLTSLASRSDRIEVAVAAQKARDDKALASLQTEESQLVDAQKRAGDDATRAADAAKVADKALADMNKTLADVQAMRERLQQILTPRKIDDNHFAHLVSVLKQFPNTPVELALERTPEAADLLVRIADALTAAGWKIVPWSGRGFPLTVNSRPNLPTVGEYTGRAVSVAVAVADREKLSGPVLALVEALVGAGVGAFPAAIADKLPDGKPNPQGVANGVVHVGVGEKP